MAEESSNGKSRLDRLEGIAETLLEHAQLAEKRLDEHDRQIQILREVANDTNHRISSLVGAIRELIDRIPPENLR